jgi:hypothetical protein
MSAAIAADTARALYVVSVRNVVSASKIVASAESVLKTANVVSALRIGTDIDKESFCVRSR